MYLMKDLYPENILKGIQFTNGTIMQFFLNRKKIWGENTLQKMNKYSISI